jgi:hypothetical protein
MHPTLSRENVVLSLIKFFTDNITTAPVDYDTWFEVRENDDKWYSINFGEFNFGKISRFPLTVVCLIQGTFENYDLAKHVDNFMSKIVSDSDNKLGVDLYDTSVTPWAKAGGFSFILENQDEGKLENGTKFVLIDISVKWGTML